LAGIEPVMSQRKQWLLCLGLLALLYAGHVWLKLAKIEANPSWDATDETGQFWSEFAFHYRFAKFFASHPVSDWDLLRRDRSLLWPDATNDWREFTIAMEIPVGLAYRWFQPDLPFHVWVVRYDCLVSSLSLFGVFLLAFALWRSRVTGLIAAAMYGTLYPSYGRTVLNLFPREDFALPLILLALWLTVLVLRQRETPGPKWLPSVAALAWALALASWHLTQFVFVLFVGALVLVWLRQPRVLLVPAGKRPLLAGLAVLVLAGLIVPVLQAKQFVLSPAMCALYGLAAAVWIDGSRRKQWATFFLAASAALACSLAMRQSYGEYGHVYDLFFAKLRFAGVKPADPSLLSWEARTLWEGPFNNAGWTEWWRSLQWCGPLALLAIVRCWNRDYRTPERVVFAVFALALVPFGWMVIRYFTFLGFAAAVLAAGAGIGLANWRRHAWEGSIAFVITWQVATLNVKPMQRVGPSPEEYRAVANWIRAYAAPDAVLLAHISEGPVLLAHTGRPIVLHSKFENQAVRDRFRSYLDAMYGTESDLFQFCQQYDVDYVVVDLPSYLMTGRDSRRYKADRLAPLATDCVIRRMAEEPLELQYFKLVFVEGRFAIFRVRQAVEPVVSGCAPLSFVRWKPS
jgi:hypothetical protein